MCDGLLYHQDTAILMEYKARLLTSREKYVGIQDATIRGIDDILGYDREKALGIGQLAKSLSKIVGGAQVSSGPGGIDLASCRHIYPVIVTYEEHLNLEATRRYADARFRRALKKRNAESPAIGPLLILTVRDLEFLESTARKFSVKSVFQDYVDYLQHHASPTSSFQTFLQARYANERFIGRPLVDELYGRALDEANAEIARREREAAPRSYPN